MIGSPAGDDRAAVAAQARAVLHDAGLEPPFRLEPITGGGNNRVFRVAAGSAPVVLKVYFRHPTDPRDRLSADFGFSAFAWQVGARALPRPLACDHAAGMAVYEYIPGRRLAPGTVTAAHVAEAAAFFRQINEHRADPRAAGLPEAAEARFSIAGHLACVSQRIERLRAIAADTPPGRAAATLVAERLRPAWERVSAAVRDMAGPTADRPLAAADRCLSPSDFGFHNALLATDGRLRFIDFEYAGHDDPAKMVCDFFCQPAVSVPRDLWAEFVAGISAGWPDPASFAGRAALLRPVYELKWCCIMLNEFLPAADSRRTFAGAGADGEARRTAQLTKVAAQLDHLGA